MPATLQLPAGPELDDDFDLKVVIVVSDEECAVSESCDTSDGCSSTCPSACNSGAYAQG
jgi:FxLD family lantipeptide